MAPCTHSPSELVVGSSGSHDLARLQDSLDTRKGPVQYWQLQAIMSLQGLVGVGSVTSGDPREHAAAPDSATPGGAAATTDGELKKAP
mmetsp:Transcript_51916/g.161069  ORF Transcript_51916/g.161069 Transcript_51916/m.161069 type:complete len:88 (+) Transcript_51916:84-347(+)